MTYDMEPLSLGLFPIRASFRTPPPHRHNDGHPGPSRTRVLATLSSPLPLKPEQKLPEGGACVNGLPPPQQLGSSYPPNILGPASACMIPERLLPQPEPQALHLGSGRGKGSTLESFQG